jgi:hypothetical protein
MQKMFSIKNPAIFGRGTYKNKAKRYECIAFEYQRAFYFFTNAIYSDDHKLEILLKCLHEKTNDARNSLFESLKTDWKAKGKEWRSN